MWWKVGKRMYKLIKAIRQQHTSTLSQAEMKELFDKYAIKYGTDKEPSTTNQKQVDREWYIYQKLHEKGLENTNIEKLLDIILDDIHHQYAMKQDMENKVGFVLALWGALIITLYDKKIIFNILLNISDTDNMLVKVINIICLLGLVIIAIMSLAFVVLTLIRDKYSKPLFGDRKDEYFRCAVDDKYLSYVYLLDLNTNIWKRNEENNENKHKRLKGAVITTSILALLIILDCFIYL